MQKEKVMDLFANNFISMLCIKKQDVRCVLTDCGGPVEVSVFCMCFAILEKEKLFAYEPRTNRKSETVLSQPVLETAAMP